MQKAGAKRIAAELGVANDDGYDLGQDAGFYINATQAIYGRPQDRKTLMMISVCSRISDVCFTLEG